MTMGMILRWCEGAASSLDEFETPAFVGEWSGLAPVRAGRVFGHGNRDWVVLLILMRYCRPNLPRIV